MTMVDIRIFVPRMMQEVDQVMETVQHKEIVSLVKSVIATDNAQIGAQGVLQTARLEMETVTAKEIAKQMNIVIMKAHAKRNVPSLR